MKISDFNINNEKVMIFLHPMLASSEAMIKHITSRIGDGYRYIIPDLSAHGEESKKTYISSKDEAEILYNYLKKENIKTYMLTGDNERTAKVIAEKLGIDDVIAEVSPEDKYKKVKDLQEQGRKVVMVGDGVNDSPALAQADVGMAIGSGTDIAIESADIVLMAKDIETILTAIRLSKATIKNIKENRNLSRTISYAVSEVFLKCSVNTVFQDCDLRRKVHFERLGYAVSKGCPLELLPHCGD